MIVKRPVLTFFAATFALSWLAWAVAASIPESASALRALVFLLGTFAPGIVALLLSSATHEVSGGESGALALLSRIIRWRVPVRLYLFALLYMAVIKLLVALATRTLTGAWPRLGETNAALMLAAIVFSTWAQAGEEVGWRGYALPRLAERFGLTSASLLLGLIWAAWHLPLFFIRAGDTFGQSFPLYALQLIAMSVALAWLYWRSGGSLLLVMLMHCAMNNTKDIVPSVVPGATNPWAWSPSPTARLTVGFLWIGAAVLAVVMRNVWRIDAPAHPAPAPQHG